MNRNLCRELLFELFDQYGFTEHREMRRQKEPMSLSKYPFPPGTLVKVRPRKPYKGSVDVRLYDRVYCSRSHRKDAYANARYVPGHGFWTVLRSHSVRGMGWWHEIVRGDGEKGWVENLQGDFAVVPSERTGEK